MAEKLTTSALHEMLAKIRPLRDPDSLYMTEGMREKIKAAVEPMLVRQEASPAMRYAGMEIFCHPAGTIVFNTKTNQRAVIDDNSVLSAIRADVRIIAPGPRLALEKTDDR